MTPRRTRFYLDKRHGKFMGVCAGIADYLGWEVLWVRVAAVLGTCFGLGFLPVVYLVVGWIADAKPRELYDESPDDQRFWAKVRVAPQRTMRDVRSSFRDADRRLRDIEAYMTSSNSRLSNEIDQLR